MISIVMPCYDRLDLTIPAVESLYQHTDSPFELVIVDNGSTDGTARWVCEQQRGRPNLRLVRLAENHSYAHATWLGAQIATGDLLLHLNNDIEARPGYLTPLVEALTEGVGAVGARLLYPDGTIQHAGVYMRTTGAGKLGGIHHHDEQPEGPVVAVTAAAMLTPTALFREFGGFDQAFHTGNEDVDYCLRLRDAGWVIWYEPGSTLTHHESQTAGRFAHTDKNVELLTRRWVHRPELWEAA